VAGAVLAAHRFPDVGLVLVGPQDVVRAELDKNAPCPPNIRIVHASQRIGMHEPPVQAFRGKKDSSIAVAVREICEGRGDALVSAGNTGAVVAASSLGLGLLEGVQRPGIAVPITAIDHPAVIIDVGANIHCKPQHLLQYGLMATVFTREVLEISDPRVGLLNVGEEERKGTDLLKDAFELLSAAPINFVGNVEAEDVFFGRCDILVCEGFAGNVLLKTSESLVAKLFDHLRTEVRQSWRRRLGLALCKDMFRSVEHCADYAEYGGAPLLGVDGVAIIGHGRSDARAIQNAVREARSFIQGKVNEEIARSIRSSLPAGTDAGRRPPRSSVPKP
jgi:glycerol-3-phosphate acyltransferase PlsX